MYFVIHSLEAGGGGPEEAERKGGFNTGCLSVIEI